jgi:hypothetical protein
VNVPAPSSDALAEAIAGLLSPVMGESMARASLRVYITEIKIKEGSFERRHLGQITGRLQQGLEAFVGREKAQEILLKIMALGRGGNR